MGWLNYGLAGLLLLGISVLELPALAQVQRNRAEDPSNTVTSQAFRGEEIALETTVTFEVQAKHVRELLKQRRFPQVEQIVDRAVKDRTLTRGGSFYGVVLLDYAFSEEFDPSLLAVLDDWVEQSSNRSLAHTARSSFYYHYAWKMRGDRFSSKTPEKAMRDYSRLLAASKADIETALELDPNNPLALFWMLRLGRNQSMPLEVFDEYFERVGQQVPFFLQAF